MKKLVLTDFTGGMVQRVTPEEYAAGEWGLLKGFVPEDDKSIRSQWAIQSIGSVGETWLENGYSGTANTSHIIAVHPLQSNGRVYLIALKQDGTIWWAHAPEQVAESNAAGATTGNYVQANNLVWYRVTAAENQGYQALEPYNQQPSISIESNPDYRFVCEVPLEVYKYTKKSTPYSQYEAPITDYERSTSTARIWFGDTHYFKVGDSIYVTDVISALNGYYTVTNISTTSPNFWVEYTTPTSANVAKTTLTPAGNCVNYWPDFTKDEVPDSVKIDDETGLITLNNTTAITPRSALTGVLLHSRRYYNDGLLARTRDLNTAVEVTNISVTSNVVTVTTAAAHGLVQDDTVQIVLQSPYTAYNGRHYVSTAPTSTTFTFPLVIADTSASVDGYCFEVFRTQTAVICYVDPYDTDGFYPGKVKAVTFPNIRRWPAYAYDGNAPTFAKSFLPMESNVVKSDFSTDDFPFINKYPYDGGPVNAVRDTTDNKNNRSAYPKPGHVFHPYTYLDWEKVLKPGTGIIPRCFTGTMWGTQLILGDIEWRGDAASPYVNEKKLDKKKNTVAGASDNSSFGLRDGNTEPHRRSFYYSEGGSIDTFDPISVLDGASSDARISGMHAINNRLVVITTAGGEQDGVISFAGNLSQLHPYTPGALANPNAVRRELLQGSVGTADTDDQYNHGNPQTCLWQNRNLVCFIDFTGYVFVTDGQKVQKLDERYPLLGKPAKSTINDHVASVGRYLFVYRNGYLLCYTTMSGGRGAWTILVKPRVSGFLITEESGYFRTFSTIRSMKGIANELYMVVHFYSLECDSNYEPLEGEVPVLQKTRVMRYALAVEGERGLQDGWAVDGLEVHTPVLGNGETNTKINWHELAINFKNNNEFDPNISIFPTTTPNRLLGISVTNRPPKEEDVQASDYLVPGGTMEYPFPNTSGLYPAYGDDLYDPFQASEPDNETDYKSVRAKAGIGPSRSLTAKFRFRGDVSISSVEVWYSGQSDAIAGRAE